MARKAAESSSTFDFTATNQRLSPQDFFRFSSEYPDRDGMSIYIYRLQPVIDRGRAGIPTSYIDLVAGPVDESYLLRTWGSGKYQLCLADSNKPKGARVANTVVEVWDAAVDPVLNPQELCPDEKGNDRWLQKHFAKGWTLEEVTHPISGRNISRLRSPERSGDGALAQTVEKLVEKVTERRPDPAAAAQPVVSELIGLVREMRSGPSQADTLKQAFDIADRLKPQSDPIQIKLLETLGNLVMKQAGTAAVLPPDPIANLKQTMDLLKDLGVGPGSGSSSGGSWMDFVTSLPGILQGGAQLLRELAILKGGNVIQMPGPAAPPAADLVPASPEAPGAPGEGQMFNVQALMGVGKDAIEAFERGIEGDDFAHAVCCRNAAGEQLYAMLYNMGKEGIISAVSMVPGLAAKLEPRRAELEAWLDKFLEYGREEEPAASNGKQVPPPGKAA